MTQSTPVGTLPPPELAHEKGAAEVLRVWVGADNTLQCNLKLQWEDPGQWGLLLAGIARDVAGAYERQGADPQAAFERLYAVFESEFVPTTDIDATPPAEA